ncbi:hypothetical protein F3I16_15940 [Pseudomonas sp. L-22-4S-12]|uniref:hypothetical protein n=1 Tax=Pseudomonas sp. L-22-4S-12 TaxID=2610893 RepID=UPI001321563F|nr:hypothetical protein [Pseudomonas sp. L-22-4S-12]MWV17533.1 hypothetical protein [Pseudomonas sp. L-22-4S-12]
MKTLHDYEQQVHAALDELDQATLEQYAEHAADNLNPAHLSELALALIKNDSAGQLLALTKIGGRIDRQRAEFMEMEALRRSRLADEDEMLRADLDADFRGAA